MSACLSVVHGGRPAFGSMMRTASDIPDDVRKRRALSDIGYFLLPAAHHHAQIANQQHFSHDNSSMM